MYFNNGTRYEGDFKNDQREGKGIFYWNEGDRYEGEFKNDQIEGLGTMYFQNRIIKKCRWKNGRPFEDSGNLFG